MVHTGQHYDKLMSDIFFTQLGIMEPNYNLNVGSGQPGEQIAKMITRLEPVILEQKPNAVLVYGDTNSTLAGAIVAAHHDVPIIHAEAGERIFRRSEVPEETNRVLTDHVASLCLTSTIRANQNLLREGMAPERVRFVGDPMYDLFRWARDNVQHTTAITPDFFELSSGKYHLATIHRAENTRPRDVLLTILEALDCSDYPVLFPAHPRVQNLLKAWNFVPKKSLKIIAPLGYLDFISLLLACKYVFTDSGGVTREAFFAKKPTVIPMQNSWWSGISESGWAIHVEVDKERIVEALSSFPKPDYYPEKLFGDGYSSRYIVNEIKGYLSKSKPEGAWHPHGSFNILPKSQSTDFTYQTYIKLIEALQSNYYQFEDFGNAAKLLSSKKRFVLMRHDIDFSLEKALKMAELESDLGIRTTYFPMLRNDFYNLFSKSGTKAISKILSLGHHLGLHFDSAAYQKDLPMNDISDACGKEVQILGNWFGISIEIVSFHRPNQLILSSNSNVSAPLLNTYMPTYTRDIKYFSDSRGKWEFGFPSDSKEFGRGTPLHILTHPIWWNDEPVFNYQVLLNFIDHRKVDLEQSLANNCSVFRVGHLNEEKHK